MKFVDIRNHDNVGLTMVKGVCVDDDDDFMFACKYRFFPPTSCFFEKNEHLFTFPTSFLNEWNYFLPLFTPLKMGNTIFIYASFQSPPPLTLF